MNKAVDPRRIMLISNSFCFGKGYFDHCIHAVRAFLGEDARRVLFVPYALKDWNGYTEIARKAFAAVGITVVSIHDRQHGLEEHTAILVGGGNTFRLLAALYRYNLVNAVRELVLAGKLTYIGASAGSNVAGPTIMTTNDMPIAFPPSFNAFGIVPFQINPHFLDADPNSRHMGEPREKRIAEFHEEDENNATVIGIREGAWMTVEGDLVRLNGTGGARIFQKGHVAREWDWAPLPFGARL